MLEKCVPYATVLFNWFTWARNLKPLNYVISYRLWPIQLVFFKRDIDLRCKYWNIFNLMLPRNTEKPNRSFKVPWNFHNSLCWTLKLIWSFNVHNNCLNALYLGYFTRLIVPCSQENVAYLHKTKCPVRNSYSSFNISLV